MCYDWNQGLTVYVWLECNVLVLIGRGSYGRDSWWQTLPNTYFHTYVTILDRLIYLAHGYYSLVDVYGQYSHTNVISNSMGDIHTQSVICGRTVVQCNVLEPL